MSKIEDIMEYYEPHSEELTKEEKERILNRTLEKAGIARKKRRFRLPVLIAACVVVLAFGAVGFAATALNPDLMDFFAPKGEEQVISLSEAALEVNQEVTQNGLTLRASQVVGDESSVHILFDIIAPEGMALSEDYYTFLRSFVSLEDTKGMGWNLEDVPDENLADNKRSFILCLAAGGQTAGDRIDVAFEDFCRNKTQEEMDARPAAGEDSFMGTSGDENDTVVSLVKGIWEFSFKLDYKNMSSTHKVNQAISLESGEIDVKEMSISPISITMRFNMESKVLGAEHMAMTVNMKDGTTAEISSGNTSTGLGVMGRKGTHTAQFRGMIDPTQIESIYLNDTKLDW